MRERVPILPDVKSFAREVALMAVIAVLLAALGPFGSYGIGDFPRRVLYWLPVSLTGYAIFRPATGLAHRAADFLGWPLPVALVGALALGAIPASILITMMGGRGFAALPPFDAVAGLYLNVLILGSVILVVFLLIERRIGHRAHPEVESPSATSNAVPFLDRLPPAWQGRLVALEMEDHYLRAHGPDGQSTLILMRMADAERELGGADGARVHRSWWVMRDAITGSRRENRGWRLDLVNGLTAPVARERVAALRERGLI